MEGRIVLEPGKMFDDEQNNKKRTRFLTDSEIKELLKGYDRQILSFTPNASPVHSKIA